MPDPDSGLPDRFTNDVKELVTTLLALGIAGVTMYMLFVAFRGAASATPDAFNRQKDLLLYSLSLFGAVIGYYFGRVPAELHAQQATAQAAKAQAALQTTQDKLATTAATAAEATAAKESQGRSFKCLLACIKQNLQQASAPPVGTIKAPGQQTGLQQAIAEIDEALRGC